MAPPHQHQHQHQQKRKRGDRNYSSDSVDRPRPSPHRPEHLSLAQTNGVNGRGGGGRRVSRGGAHANSYAHANTHAHASPSPAPTPTPISTSTPMAAPARPASPSPAAGKTAASQPDRLPGPVKPAPSHGAPRPAQQTLTPAFQFPPPGSAPQQDPTPYLYSFITQDRRDTWQDSGRQALVEDALARAEAEEYQELGVFFQEVLHLVTEGLANPTDTGTLVKEILETSAKSEMLDLPALFLDMFAVCLGSQYTTGKEDTGKELGINQFLQATGVDKKLVCTLLDEKLLMALRVVRGTFDRMGIRHSTNVLYRQSGFNLLREESEGYSKLMTEFFTVTHNFKPDKDTVEKTWEKIKALIGAFDLDVGRVLDITLDAFANNLIKHNKFFIRLLKHSDFWPQRQILVGFSEEPQDLSTLPPWSSTDYPGLETLPTDLVRIEDLRHGRDIMFWDRVREVGVQAFFELGGRRAMTNEAASAFLETLRNQEIGSHGDDKTKEQRKGEEEEADLWALRTHTLPPQGNSIAAQILGFKLRFYASEARDATDRLSVNLIWLAALLIKIGFISLKDLYPHIYPTDDKMNELREKLEKERAERLNRLKPGAGINALTAAGALSEGEPHSIPVTRSLQDVKAGGRTPLRAAEAAGATPAGSTPGQPAEAPAPTLPEPEDQKIILLRSLLLIGAIPDALYILGRFPWLIDVHDDLPKYVHRLLHHMLSKVYADTKSLRGRASDLDPGRSRVEVNNTPLLEPRKTPKSIAWGNLEKTEWSEGDNGTSYRFYWDDWNDLVPICQTVDDVFALCDTFFNLVGHKIGRDAELLSKLIRIGVKSLRDDDSPENAARWQKLSKRLIIPALSLTKADPGIVNEAWELIKYQPTQTRYNMYSEWYGGQTSRMLDVKTAFDLSRIFTKDVLKRISKTNIRDMARALAKVSYASPGAALATGLQQIESYNNLIDTLIECIRYFTYIGFDVLVWQLLNSLGGSSRDRMQADGMILSKWLQRLAEFTGKVCKRYYKELDIKPILLYIKDRLKQGDSAGLGVLGQMVLSMGGIHSDQNWSEEQVIALAGRSTLRSEVLKRVGDNRHSVKRESLRLVQALTSTGLAGDFLILIAQERQQYLERPSSSGAPIKVLSTNLTSLQSAFVQYLEFLRSNYTIEDFDAVVPALDQLIGTYRIEPAIAFTISRPSIQHQIEQVNKNLDPTKTGAQSSGVNGDVEMKDESSVKSKPALHGTGESEITNGMDAAGSGDSLPGTPAAVTSNPLTTVHDVLQNVIERLNVVLESGFEHKMSMLFYVRFWQSSLGDLVVGPYEEEVKSARNARNEVNSNRTDMSAKAQKEKAAKRTELVQTEKDLQDEWRMATRHKIVMSKTFMSEKVLWFPPESFGPSKHNELTSAIVQDCILPRIILSEMDALFTAKYLFMVHKMNTPGFRTAKILARLFNEQQFVATLFMLTEREARNLGIFMKEVLGQLKIWRDNKSTYEKEGAGPNNENPGFARVVREDNTVDGKDPDGCAFSHPDYQRLLYKWHNNLFTAIMQCLSSKEFMHIRNAIFFVKQVHEYFPSITFHGSRILDQVQKIAKDDERDDLKLSAASLQGDLQKMKLSARWMIPQNFRPGEVGVPGSTKGGASRSGTPRPSLNAEAKEFKPKEGGSSRDEEDGEIEDEKIGADQMTGVSEVMTETPAPVARTRAGEVSRATTPTIGAKVPLLPTNDTSRPSTPADSMLVTTARQDNNRTPLTQGPISTMPGGLPARPQGPLPPHRDLHRRPEAAPSRHDQRPEEQHGWFERPPEPSRDGMRRRSRSPGVRGRNRSPEVRLPRIDADRRDLGPSALPLRDGFDTRDPRPARPPREPRDERHRGDRDPRRHDADLATMPSLNDARDRAPRPLEQSIRSTGPIVNPDRAAMIPGMNLNPDRAALLAQDSERKISEDRRPGRGRHGVSPSREELRSVHPSSRGTSPRRSDRAGPERPPPRSGPRDRRDEHSSMPSAADSHRGRNELFPGPARNGPFEPNHGRLPPPEPRPPQDPNYGRLNAPTAPETAPSGPRGRSGQPRNGRLEPAPNSSGSRSMTSSSPIVPPQSSPGQDRAPPSGPAGPNRRPAANLPPQAPSSAPQGPAADNVASGIHPSRLQNIPALPPVQTNNTGAPTNISSIPSGPRSGMQRSAPGQSNIPTASSTNRFPPTGPSTGGGSLRGNRSALGLINGVLQDQQPPRNPVGTSVRGRGSVGGGSQQESAPQSPTTGPATSFPAQTMPPPGQTGRPDSLSDLVERPGTSGSDEQRVPRRTGDRGPRDESGGRRRHGRSRSRSPRREAADNAMRQSGDVHSFTEGQREDGSRRRESGGRDRRSRGGDGLGHGRERERDRIPRDGRDSRAPSRNEGRPPMSAPLGPQPNPFASQVPPPPPPGPNGDMRGGPGGRRDDRDRRDDGSRGGRDNSKRRRPEDGLPGPHPEQKRPRRGQ